MVGKMASALAFSFSLSPAPRSFVRGGLLRILGRIPRGALGRLPLAGGAPQQQKFVKGPGGRHAEPPAPLPPPEAVEKESAWRHQPVGKPPLLSFRRGGKPAEAPSRNPPSAAVSRRRRTIE